MRILIIRHADPDYVNDCLTAKGRTEAESLARHLKNERIDSFYVSPLGRAAETASYTLRLFNTKTETLPWLREFHAPISKDGGEKGIPWDWLPSSWTKEEKYYKRDSWFDTHAMREGDVISEAVRVWDGFDEIMARHGYVRRDNIYNAVRPNDDTIAFFCHFGVECVILSHILGVSPMILWHGTCALTTSVTTLYTEERRRGTASLRMTSFGSTAHLTLDGIEPSFSGRFCEMYDNENERHD